MHVGDKGYRYGRLNNEQNDIHHLAAAAYADDLAAVTNTVKDMEDQASKITAFCHWARLEVNVKNALSQEVSSNKGEQMVAHGNKEDRRRELCTNYKTSSSAGRK